MSSAIQHMRATNRMIWLIEIEGNENRR